MTTTVLNAGDDTHTKALLTALMPAACLRAVDARPVHRARKLGALGFLQITLAGREVRLGRKTRDRLPGSEAGGISHGGTRLKAARPLNADSR